MAKIKGFKEYTKWELDHNSVTMKESILAQCYQCNGFEEGSKDCGSRVCPLYKFHPYNKHKAKSGRSMTEEQRKAAIERLKKAREKK